MTATEVARSKSPGQLAYWLAQVDPDNTLPEQERQRRAESARRAYFVRLAYKSARARRGGGEPDDPAAA